MAQPSPQQVTQLLTAWSQGDEKALEQMIPVVQRELRFLGKLTMEETAAVMKISLDIVTGDWNVARLWLQRELSKTGGRRVGDY